MTTSKFRYTLKPERLHETVLKLKTFSASVLPASVDLRPRCPPVYDQGALSSCTANAIVAAYQVDDSSFMGSRLFLYYCERAALGTIATDNGAYISTGINALKSLGMPAETTWPYVPTNFAVAPPAAAYTEALNHKVINATNLALDMDQMKGSLAAGFPIIVGITIYASFEGPVEMHTGKIPMPTPGEAVLGGHAILVVGYNDNDKTWICRNSWGSGIMDKGYFYLPYDYLSAQENIASDLWNISAVTPEPTPAPKPSPAPIPCGCDIA